MSPLLPTNAWSLCLSLAYLSLVPASPTTSSAHTEAVNYAKEIQIQRRLLETASTIHCDPTAGLPAQSPDAPSWYRANDYPSLKELCSYSEEYSTVGCTCADRAHLMTCHRHLADPDLYDDDFIRQTCLENCRCSEQGPLESYPNGTVHDFQDFDYLGSVHTSSQTASKSGSAPSNEQPSGQRTCTTQCSHYDTSCGGKPCRCKAKKVQSGGTFFFRGICAVSRLPKVKRAEDDEIDEGGCACNGTYISRRCCDDDVQDGLVWEGPNMKMGELML